jgi:predicted N-acetyltransferase YhbS
MVDNATNAVIGFYALSNFTLLSTDLPTELGRALPGRIPLPAHLIGQLAVDVHQQGKGYGSILLLDALHRAYRTTTDSASLAVVVHALDADAAAWYARYGFAPLSAHPLHLFMPMKDITRFPSLPTTDNTSA